MFSPTAHGGFARRVVLESGALNLRVECADAPLDQLCGFASRNNPKRGYLFVSKVLGKHYPVRPSVMDAVHARLAAKLAPLDGPAVVLGLAETATGLAQGVYEHLWRRGRGDLLFQHTTRVRLRRPLALEFDEPHSHAPRHRLYEAADPAHRRLFAAAAHLILVDDEISTGATLANLARAYRRVNPRLQSVRVVSLTNWLPPRKQAEFEARAGAPAEFHSLLRGTFAFKPNDAFAPAPLADRSAEGPFLDQWLTDNHGRLGKLGPLRFTFERPPRVDDLCPGARVLVLGTGEFLHPPFLWARALEARGLDVRFQSTTRSPIRLGGPIASVARCADNYRAEAPNYVYNVADRPYDRIFIGYEVGAPPAARDLPWQLNAEAVYFHGSRLQSG